MGFNLGAFAAGVAEGGTDTYLKLQEQKRRDAEMKRQEDVHKAWLQDQQENERLRTLTGETYGRVGQPEAFRTAGGEMGPQPEATQTALPANAAEAFPAQKMYSAEQAAKEFQTKAMGINPIKAAEYQTRMQAARKGALEISSLERAATQDAAFDKHMEETHKSLANMRQDIQGTFDADGMNGLVKKYGADFKDATGNTVALVGNALVIKDSKGKVVGQPFTKPEDAINGLSNVLGKKAMEASLDAMVTKGLFKDSNQLMTYFKDRSAMRSQEQTAAAHTMQGQAALQNAATQASVAPSTIALHNAQAGMATAHAGVFNQSLELAKTNKEAREAMQPFLDDIAKLPDPNGKDKAEFERLSMKAIAAGAAKSADIKGLLEASKKADKSVPPEIDPEAKKQAYQELREAGTDAKAIKAVKDKWAMVFGPTATDKAIASFAASKNAPAAAAPAAAIPRVDTDEIPRPAVGRALPQGSYVPNGRTLLNTPKYGVGTNTFNPND